MTGSLVIRETGPEDAGQVLALYPQVFPDEELSPVVSALLDEDAGVLSLAGFDGKVLAGHVMFTACGDADDSRAAALLAPLGVHPSYQRQGVGTALVRAGLERLQTRECRQVFVLGDPAYYRRFGFRPEPYVQTPYPIPDNWADAWQSLQLAEGTRLAGGRLSVMKPWMQPALWAP